MMFSVIAKILSKFPMQFHREMLTGKCLYKCYYLYECAKTFTRHGKHCNISVAALFAEMLSDVGSRRAKLQTKSMRTICINIFRFDGGSKSEAVKRDRWMRVLTA